MAQAMMNARRDLLGELPILAQVTAPDTDADAYLPVHPGAAAYYNSTQQLPGRMGKRNLSDANDIGRRCLSASSGLEVCSSRRAPDQRSGIEHSLYFGTSDTNGRRGVKIVGYRA
jgi:hypothetical protein